MKTTQILNNFTQNVKGGPKYEKTWLDFFMFAIKERDFTIKGLLKTFENKKLENIKKVNKFFPHHFARLGAELNAAHYVVKLGGKCQLQNSKWIELGNNSVDKVLPNDKNSNVIVKGLDFSKTVIQFEGISNFEYCSNLKTLLLKDCLYVDDWFLAKISHCFSDTLESLDISGCNKITDDGLIRLGYLKNLKKLIIKDLVNSKNKEYISILLEENVNGLEIEGVDHLNQNTLIKVENSMKDQLKKI